MKKTVCFRDFEERDIDFIYKCKNDEKLNSMIVGHFKPFSYEDAEKWVHGCMGEHETFKFWAIATNDEEKRIVGWISLSEIDQDNRSAQFHGIVIGDKDYHDGSAWIESYLFILDYAFEVLSLNRLTDLHLVDHPMSGAIAAAMYFEVEGIYKEAILKNNQYKDIEFVALLKRNYESHKLNNDYKFNNIVKNIIKYNKERQL